MQAWMSRCNLESAPPTLRQAIAILQLGIAREEWAIPNLQRPVASLYRLFQPCHGALQACNAPWQSWSVPLQGCNGAFQEKNEPLQRWNGSSSLAMGRCKLGTSRCRLVSAP